MLVDTHCHVDRFPDPMALASDCETKRIATISVTNIPSHYEIAARHIGKCRYVKPALGFHPMAVKENFEQLSLFLNLLEHATFVGEIGLDFSTKGVQSKCEQLKAFRTIAEALSRRRRFVTLHSLGAAEEVLDVLSEFEVNECVFHWFSGTVSTLKKLVSSGHYFSINTEMLETAVGRDVLKRVPHDRILTESDGPYVKIGRRPASPRDMNRVLVGIGKAWGVSVQEAESQVCGNFEKLCASLGITRYE